MLFTAPIPPDAAISQARDRDLLPTNLSSRELRELSKDIRSASVFSARLKQLKVLQKLRDLDEELNAGKINEATARNELQKLVLQLGYTPEKGFPGEGAEPVKPGSLRDFSSAKRVDLQLTTQWRQAMNKGLQIAGNQPERLWQYPCYELVRLSEREVPRGYRRGPKGALLVVPDDDWPSRWEKVGGELVDGERMVARKDDPIWDALGSSDNFDDALDTNSPPFAFNSGWGWREVDRQESIALGVIDADEGAEAMPVDLLEGLRADAKQFDPDLLKAFLSDLKKEGDYLVPLRASQARDLEEARASYRSNERAMRRCLDNVLILCNAGTSDGARQGWETRRDNGWTPKERNLQSARGLRAMRTALRDKRDAVSAMVDPELGPIDFPYEGHGGKGVARIVDEHGLQAALRAPKIIAYGEKLPPQGNNQVITKDSWRVVLTKTEGRDKRHWLLTAYEKIDKNEKRLSNSREDLIPSSLRTTGLHWPRPMVGAVAIDTIAPLRRKLNSILEMIS